MGGKSQLLLRHTCDDAELYKTFMVLCTYIIINKQVKTATGLFKTTNKGLVMLQ